MVSRKGSRIRWEFYSPEGKKFSAFMERSPDADEWTYRRGKEYFPREDFDRWGDETEAYFGAKRKAKVQASRQKGAKKQAQTRKKNFVSKREVREPFGSEGYYYNARVSGVPRTDNEGRGSRIHTSKYAGKGARQKDMEVTRYGNDKWKNGVHYSSVARRGRY